MNKYSPEYMTKRIQEPMTLQSICQAIDDKAILEGRVVCCDSDFTLTIDLGRNILGKIKLDDFEYTLNNNETNRHSVECTIYKHIKFIPLSVSKENGIYIVQCSRKLAQEECFNNYIKNLKVGDIIDVTITNINKYGAFCDIGCGIIALLPTNNLSITHVEDPSDFLRNIHSLKVVVKSIDKNYRIQLTHRELLGTWKEEAANIHIDDIICGTVLSVEKYGVFVRLSQNISGLADSTPIELEINDKVLVRVSFIKEENMKIKLVIISKLDKQADEKIRNHFNYRVEGNHISEWHYSTPTAKKQIDSYFS